MTKQQLQMLFTETDEIMETEEWGRLTGYHVYNKKEDGDVGLGITLDFKDGEIDYFFSHEEVSKAVLDDEGVLVLHDIDDEEEIKLAFFWMLPLDKKEIEEMFSDCRKKAAEERKAKKAPKVEEEK